jgi:Tfp pilus assembly protein PilP
MNLFVVGALLGDLRPHSTDKDNVADVPAKVAPAKTNAPAVAPVKAAAVTNAPTNAAAPAAATTKTNELSPAEIAKQAMAKFSLKGVNKSANQPLAMVNTGVRTYTVAVGESTLVETPKGKFTMHCDEVTDNKATLSINGQQTTLFLHY